MPDTNTPSPELTALQQAWNDAHQAVADYCTSVDTLREAGRDAEIADAVAAGQKAPAVTLRPWTDEESDALRELRATRDTARQALWGHPDVEAALGDGSWKTLHQALKEATGAEGWVKAGK